MTDRTSKSWRDARKIANVCIQERKDSEHGKSLGPRAGAFYERVCSIRKLGIWESMVLADQANILINESFGGAGCHASCLKWCLE